MSMSGPVSLKSARAAGLSAPEDTASARYIEYAPPWAPITLRCARAVIEPITGPRARAVAAPQWIGNRWGLPPAECDVRRIWPGGFWLIGAASTRRLR